RKVDGNQAELRVNANQIDTAALSQSAGIDRILPVGRANFSAMLKGHGEGWPEILSSANGTIAARFGQGSLPGLDINALLERTARGGFFPLWSGTGGSTAIGGAELRAEINNGSAKLDVAQVRLDANRSLFLTGLVPW